MSSSLRSRILGNQRTTWSPRYTQRWKRPYRKKSGTLSMQDRFRGFIRRAFITAASISVAVAAWATFAQYFAFPDLVPSPWDTFGTGARMIASGALLSHVAISLERVLVGYAAGCI